MSPVAVRYAWADNPDRANLYSNEGFPASPFRTDAWDLLATDIEVSTADTASLGNNNSLRARLDAGGKQTIVVYGTSLTKVSAWSDQLRVVLEQHYPGQVNLINSAQGGSNSGWGRNHFEEKVIRKNPDTLFIEFAINDAVAGRKVSIEKARANLEDMINRQLESNPNCEIILMTMNSAVSHHGARRPNLADYYQMYRDVAADRGFQLIDHYQNWESLLNEDPARFLSYVPDGVHPIREGILQVMVPTVIKALGLPEGRPEVSEEVPCLRYMFNNMNKGKQRDSAVSRAEYEAFWAADHRKNDANKDGALQPSEFGPSVLLECLDLNRNGSVELDEYMAAYIPLFERWDLNADGMWDKSEL